MAQVSFGTILREARERKGYDVQSAARRLRIRPDILRAIENNDFSRLPARGYTRNMVNAYARLVGLNPSDITRMYLDEAYAYQVGRTRGESESPAHVSGRRSAMKKIINATPASRQTLLFSATIDHTIMKTAGKLLRNPAMVEIAHKGETADTVEQYVMHVQQAVKPALLKGLLKERGHKRVIVFCRTRSRADATCRRLKKVGYSVEAIHSSRSQNQRRRALDNFAEGKTDVLVATDVLARGIDVEEVEYVVNYDLPTVPEDYVHRIGRTGRAGATGFAVSFVSPETADALRDIQKLVKREIPELELEDFDMHEAEMEAAAKAQQAEARRDPEIQQAKKEEAARKRKKARAREAAAAVEDARSNRKGAHNNHGGKKSADKPATGTAKASKKRANTPTSKPAKAKQRPAKGGQGDARKGSAGKGAPKRAAQAPAGDFRPGRAHRAAVASQRSKRR